MLQAFSVTEVRQIADDIRALARDTGENIAVSYARYIEDWGIALTRDDRENIRLELRLPKK